MHVYPSEACVISMPAVNLSSVKAPHCNKHTKSIEYLTKIKKLCAYSNKSFILW